MSVQMTPNIDLSCIETLALGVDAAVGSIVNHRGFNISGNNYSATNGPITKCSYQTYALVAGAKTIDLTALEGVNDVAQDCTGLKVQFFIIRNPTGNAAITITDGASNGYNLFGDASGQVTLGPGAWIVFGGPETLQDVASGDRTIDVAGTGTQLFDLGIVLG